MGWFSVLKGAYPSLLQIDKTLAVASGETGIVRGSLIYEDSATWKLATATQATDVEAYLYYALMSQEDLTAGMAGSRGQGAPNGVPRVTGLACSQPMEFETSEYDTGESYAVGDLLTCGASGKLTPHSTLDNCVAQVTKAPYSRWVNDAIAITGYRTGANVNVITARSLWVPRLATS